MANNSPYRASSDLVMEVLSITGILAVGQGVDPEDFAVVNNNLDSIIRKLAGLEIVFIPDENNIPGAWFKDLAAIVAGECASDLGIVDPEYSMLVNAGLGGVGQVDIGAGSAAKSLKIMTRGKPTYETLRIMNF